MGCVAGGLAHEAVFTYANAEVDYPVAIGGRHTVQEETDFGLRIRQAVASQVGAGC